MDWQPRVLEAVETLRTRNAPCLSVCSPGVAQERGEGYKQQGGRLWKAGQCCQG